MQRDIRFACSTFPAGTDLLSVVDFGKTAQAYAEHRAGFPEALFERLAPFKVLFW